MVGQANFTFVSPPCSVGGDRVAFEGRKTSDGVWTFDRALANADPSLACAFAAQRTISGAYSPAGPGCIGTATNNICFSAALTQGANSQRVTMCWTAAWGGCRASVGPATIVIA